MPVEFRAGIWPLCADEVDLYLHADYGRKKLRNFSARSHFLCRPSQSAGARGTTNATSATNADAGKRLRRLFLFQQQSLIGRPRQHLRLGGVGRS